MILDFMQAYIQCKIFVTLRIIEIDITIVYPTIYTFPTNSSKSFTLSKVILKIALFLNTGLMRYVNYFVNFLFSNADKKTSRQVTLSVFCGKKLSKYYKITNTVKSTNLQFESTQQVTDLVQFRLNSRNIIIISSSSIFKYEKGEICNRKIHRINTNT